MFSTDQAERLRGATVVDADGDKIGSVAEVYRDEDTGQPEWLAVKIGLVGTRVSFVPLADARVLGGALWLPYEKSAVRHAPSTEADDMLTAAEAERLYAHYAATEQVWG
jgi:sporulation protein YlmC with PRC-barrel domain